MALLCSVEGEMVLTELQAFQGCDNLRCDNQTWLPGFEHIQASPVNVVAMWG